MSTAIETHSLFYKPGRGFELGDLSISVPEGSVYGFLGPNGSGKTTTIKLLLGLLRPQRGSITVLGWEIPRQASETLAQTGYVPEAPHLYRSLRVAQAIDYHSGFYEHWDAALAERLRERFYLPPRQRVSSLSKGETGKLMMLLALAQRPRLLVLDEPTDGLDPVVRRDILDALNDVVKRGDATVFMSSHLVHEIELICDWIAVMDRGNLVAELPMTEFRNEIKVLHFRGVPPEPRDTPFSVLRRDGDAGAEEHRAVRWTVRGWRPGMESYFDGTDATVTEIEDVDLENGFVELLRSFRRGDV
jgi:ABC-2 type transport system ATP-binding protein